MTVARFEVFDAEEPVIEAIRRGDRSAFGEFLRRHNGWVRGVIYGVLGDRDRVDDVAQQVWTAVWQRVGELRDAKSWRTWLYRLARNASIDAGRDATRRRQRLPAIRAEPACDPAWTPDQQASGRERHQVVLSAVQALPSLYREPFVFRHMCGWSYAQIAELMDMPVDTVETRLVRARRLLRESLKDLVKGEAG